MTKTDDTRPRVFALPLPTPDMTRVRFVDRLNGRECVAELHGTAWRIMSDGQSPTPGTGMAWHELLGRAVKGEVTDATPPREPRIFPKLDRVPDDLGPVRGASGTVYPRHEIPGLDRWRIQDGDHEDWRPLAWVQQVDGPLTEVFDA